MKYLEQKIAIYSRKSKFTGKGESCENQIELCKAYIWAHFPKLAYNILIFEDEGYSGGHLDRPKFREMMSLIKKKEISHIICYRLDRISRNIGDFAVLIEELNDLGCGFISIKEQFDTSSPMGRAMMYIASVFSQLERETIAERIRDNMRELAKTGRWLGGVTPTGFYSQPVEKITVDGKFKKAFKLVPIDEEISLVKLIFSKFIETNSLSATETYLVQNNYKTKNGRDFSRFTIKNILENPVYMIADKSAFEFFDKQNVEIYSDITEFDDKSGIMAYNKTIQKRGKAHETREMSDWIIAVSKHEGIISGVDFSKVFDMLAHNKDKSYRKPRSHVALLSGILYCTCGDYMRPKMSSNKNADGEFIYSYLCTMKEKSKMKKCKMKNPNGNNLDKLVCDEIKKLSTEPSMFLAELERVRSEIKTDSESVSARLERLQKLKNDKQNDIEKLTATVTNIIGTPAEVHLLKKLNDDGLELKKIEQSIEELKSIITQNAMTDSEFDLLKDILSNFASTFDDMGVEQKRMALRTFVKKIIWDGENAHIYPPDVDASLGDTTETKQTHVGDEDHIDPNNETQNHNQNQTNRTGNPSPTKNKQTDMMKNGQTNVGDGALDVPNDQLWTLSEHRK